MSLPIRREVNRRRKMWGVGGGRKERHKLAQELHINTETAYRHWALGCLVGRMFLQIINRTEDLMKGKKGRVPPEGQAPASPPPQEPHMALFQRRRNSGRTHVSGCTVNHVEPSGVYREGEAALIRPEQTCFYLFSFA